MFDNLPLILAQEGEAPTPSPATPAINGTQQPADNGTIPPQQQGGINPNVFLLVMLAVFVLFILFSSSSQRKERKKREQMLSAIKKGDKVQTIGGILGTIMEVRDHEVLVKVDENTNTRIRLARSSVQSVVEEKD